MVCSGQAAALGSGFFGGRLGQGAPGWSGVWGLYLECSQPGPLCHRVLPDAPCQAAPMGPGRPLPSRSRITLLLPNRPSPWAPLSWCHGSQASDHSDSLKRPTVPGFTRSLPKWDLPFGSGCLELAVFLMLEFRARAAQRECSFGVRKGPTTHTYKSSCAPKPVMLVVACWSGPSQGRRAREPAIGLSVCPGLAGECAASASAWAEPIPALAPLSDRAVPAAQCPCLLLAPPPGVTSSAPRPLLRPPPGLSVSSLQAPHPADPPVGGAPGPGGHQLAARPLHHADLHHCLLQHLERRQNIWQGEEGSADPDCKGPRPRTQSPRRGTSCHTFHDAQSLFTKSARKF